MPPSLEIQLAQLYQPGVKDSTLLVTAEPVQQQRGKTDCGLFSIAFAYSAANGEDVSRLQLDQDQLRAHLTLCFEQQELTVFPPSQSAVQKSRKRHFAIHVYCVSQKITTHR